MLILSSDKLRTRQRDTGDEWLLTVLTLVCASFRITLPGWRLVDFRSHDQAIGSGDPTRHTLEWVILQPKIKDAQSPGDHKIAVNYRAAIIFNQSLSSWKLMAIQPIEVWGHYGAPNPWKVCMILEELDVPYHVLYLDLPDAKSPSFLKINPNGRLPAIKDPNTDVTLWESGAIILYLVDEYDSDNKISYRESPNKYLTQQWLAFQISGQAPSLGQATWYARFHPEKLPSVIDRHMNEMLRVMDVLDKSLKENGTGWLVGRKCTYADISFKTWATVAQTLLNDFVNPESYENRFPAYTSWLEAMDRMKPVQKINQKISEGMNKGGVRMI